jgi:hypothetical protein
LEEIGPNHSLRISLLNLFQYQGSLRPFLHFHEPVRNPSKERSMLQWRRVLLSWEDSAKVERCVQCSQVNQSLETASLCGFPHPTQTFLVPFQCHLLSSFPIFPSLYCWDFRQDGEGSPVRIKDCFLLCIWSLDRNVEFWLMLRASMHTLNLLLPSIFPFELLICLTKSCWPVACCSLAVGLLQAICRVLSSVVPLPFAAHTLRPPSL